MRRELDETTSKILDLYDNAPCGYHSIDKNGWIVEINQTELPFGVMNEGNNWKEKILLICFPLKVKTALRSLSPDTFQQNVIKDLEYEMVRENGETFFVQLTATAITDSNGNFLYSRAIIVDISERRKNETKVDYLNSIVEQSSDAMSLAGESTTKKDGNYINVLSSLTPIHQSEW
ncbi:MAG: PAS domain-containing protein [Bacteroidetes bacterium]|nr:PAS domain-containing protein [Bacteroidota bacterium]